MDGPIGAMSPEEARRKVEFICKTVAAPYLTFACRTTTDTVESAIPRRSAIYAVE